MNNPVTSREELLKAAAEIAHKEGLSKVTIRGVAAACGVAVGSIYNYFPTKGDLVFAIIEDFWRRAIHSGMQMEAAEKEGFLPFFHSLYSRFATYLSAFENDWLGEMGRLTTSERQKGKAMEEAYFGHIKGGLLEALRRDRAIAPTVWAGAFTEEGFVDFIFQNMMMGLRAGKEELPFLEEAARRLLYSR